jgi:hypothetical protein
MNNPVVYYAALCERAGAANDECYNSMLDVAEFCGANGYKHLRFGYTRTDVARNEFYKTFMANTTRDNDLLVMLDGDHKHPADIVGRLAVHDHEQGVVGALAFRRGEPYDPLFFIRANGSLHSLAEIVIGNLYQCAIVSTSAISIRRWVFLELLHKGYTPPYFRYEYPTDGSVPSEDMYFGRICEQAGIWHYCDTAIEIPHAAKTFVDYQVHAAFMANHQHLTETISVEAAK